MRERGGVGERHGSPWRERRRAASTESEALGRHGRRRVLSPHMPHHTKSMRCYNLPQALNWQPTHAQSVGIQITPRRPYWLVQQPMCKHQGYSMSMSVCVSVHAKGLARREIEHGEPAYRVRAGRNLLGSGAAARLGAEEAPTPAPAPLCHRQARQLTNPPRQHCVMC